MPADWNACAATALTPPGSYLHAWTAAAFAHLRKGRRVRLLSIWRGHILGGAVAIDRSLWRWGFPLPGSGGLATSAAFDGAPLIGDAGAPAIIDTLLASHGGTALVLNAFPADGPLADLLQARARALDAPVAILETRQRAALKPAGDYAAWFDGNFDRKRRKEYRRLRARLGELGRLESIAWTADMPVKAWLDDLVQLEAMGWKGERGTSLQQNGEILAALGAALPALAADGHLRFWKIALDGRPIAMMFAVVSGDRAWLGKIAYDEAHREVFAGRAADPRCDREPD